MPFWFSIPSLLALDCYLKGCALLEQQGRAALELQLNHLGYSAPENLGKGGENVIPFPKNGPSRKPAVFVRLA